MAGVKLSGDYVQGTVGNLADQFEKLMDQVIVLDGFRQRTAGGWTAAPYSMPQADADAIGSAIVTMKAIADAYHASADRVFVERVRGIGL